MHIWRRLRGQNGETKDSAFIKADIIHPFPFLRSGKDKGGFLDSGYNTTSSSTTKNNLLSNVPVKSDTQKNNLSITKNTGGVLGKCKKIYL